MAKKKKNLPRKYLYLVSALIVAVLVVVILEVTNTTHLFHKSPVVRSPTQPIAKLPAQPATTNKVPAVGSTLNPGTADDKNGQMPNSGVPADPSKWSTSTSGVITVKLPSANSTIQSGATLTGSASINQVQYRLTDDKVGVISQGPISVVNGNFSASINFTTSGSAGRLDVYSTEPNGREINEVQIPVNF